MTDNFWKEFQPYDSALGICYTAIIIPYYKWFFSQTIILKYFSKEMWPRAPLPHKNLAKIVSIFHGLLLISWNKKLTWIFFFNVTKLFVAGIFLGFLGCILEGWMARDRDRLLIKSNTEYLVPGDRPSRRNLCFSNLIWIIKAGGGRGGWTRNFYDLGWCWIPIYCLVISLSSRIALQTWWCSEVAEQPTHRHLAFLLS